MGIFAAGIIVFFILPFVFSIGMTGFYGNKLLGFNRPGWRAVPNEAGFLRMFAYFLICVALRFDVLLEAAMAARHGVDIWHLRYLESLPVWPFVMLPVVVTEIYALAAARDYIRDRRFSPLLPIMLLFIFDAAVTALCVHSGWTLT